jgi:hypothetical protein
MGTCKKMVIKTKQKKTDKAKIPTNHMEKRRRKK